MRILGPQDPLHIAFWMDKTHLLYVAVPQTPIFLRCQANGIDYGFVCKRCLQWVHGENESKQLTCSPRCKGLGALTNLAKFGEDHFVARSQWGRQRPIRPGRQAFPLDLLKVYTKEWQVFEQELTLLRVMEEVRESVLRIHEVMKLTDNARTPRYRSFKENQKDLEFRSRVKMFDRVYYPEKLGLT